MKKRILALLLSALMLASVTACNTKIPSDEETGSTSEVVEDRQPNPATDFEYEVNSKQSGIIITKYVGTSEHVIIPSEIDGLPVISIHYVTDWQAMDNIGAFEGSAIKSVVIPESVMSLACAFMDCAQLREVTFLGDSQLYDISCAFKGCTSLEKIDLSGTVVKRIDNSSFDGCTNLKEIKFPKTLETIGERAFYECSSLIEVDFPESLTEIGREAFGYCTSLKRIVIPPQLSLWASDKISFHNMDALEEIVFEEGRESIVGYAFFDTTSNPKILIPSSVTKFSSFPFFVHGEASFIFYGDCPEIVEEPTFYGTPTIYYDPNTKGWDSCLWKELYEMKPMVNGYAMRRYEAAIRGEISVFDENLGEIKLRDCRFPSDNLSFGECEILSKAILDLDGDGVNEYVIQSPDKDHIVLRYYNGKVYSYCFDAKSFFNLNTDGSFYWIDSYDLSNCTRGYNQIAFEGSSLRIKEIYRIKQTSPYDYGDGDHAYFVDGKQITHEEFVDYYDSNCRGTRMAIFSPLDISCVYPISSEKAFELASEFWGFKSGMYEGAAGTHIVNKIVILEKPNNGTPSYRIGWQMEGYHTHVIDSVYAQPPSFSIYEELTVDAITGECREYVESDTQG